MAFSRLRQAFTGASPQPPPSNLLPVVHSEAPCPPNWTESLHTASIQVQSPFLKIPVPPTSAEYQELARLFGSGIAQLDRVVNPELWKRFCRTRADLLAAKSEDLKLLAALGHSDQEVAQRAAASRLPGFRYCDNVVLLFHGCKGQNSVDKILSQGLDERLGAGGTFGRGIYFADDPRKAMQYDTNGVLIVCAVMLGDCLVVSGGNTVREPEKSEAQKRNHLDLFFDSIVGSTGSNEYVVFNRAQCCPLYTITYNKSGYHNMWGMQVAHPRSYTPAAASTSSSANDYASARARLASFAWGGGAGGGSPSPFYARRIFQAMGAGAGAVAEQPQVARPAAPRGQQLQDEEQSLGAKLTQLSELGFSDKEKNKKLLDTFGYDLEWTIDHLVEERANLFKTETPPAATAAAGVADLVEEPLDLDMKLLQLSELGFTDRVKNKQVLQTFGFDLEWTIDHLVGAGKGGSGHS